MLPIKRCVIIDTRTRWTVDIPDDIPDNEKVKYAWKRLLLIADRIPKAGKKDLRVQFFPPWDLHDVLLKNADPEEQGQQEAQEQQEKRENQEKQNEQLAETQVRDKVDDNADKKSKHKRQ